VDRFDQILLALDYLSGFDERVVSEGELALIYAVLPELLSGITIHLVAEE
jgi:hypothetical protein